MSDTTCVYYTANKISDHFAKNTKAQLVKAIGDIPLISVSHKPMDFGTNIVVDLPYHHLSIYKQALIGAKAATTKYITLAEDDTLYSPDHFQIRPTSDDIFTYNVSQWSIYTWVKPPMFTFKGRRNLYSLICNRELFIEAMEERFAKYPDGKVNLGLWGEPGKYERQLGVTIRTTEQILTGIPLVVFSHETAMGYLNLGKRKKVGAMRAIEVPYWHRAEDILKLYNP